MGDSCGQRSFGDWENGMNLELESMAIEMPEVEGHPNRVAFRGVLTFVGVPSDEAPAAPRASSDDPKKGSR